MLSVLAGSVAAGCVPFKKTSPFWGTIAAPFDQPEGPVITREYAQKLPYASMLAWFEDGPKALVVLAEIEAGDRWTWHSAERQSLTTYGPFVVKAIGTEMELRGSILGGGWSKNPLDMVGRQLGRSLDVAVENQRVQVALDSDFVSAGDATIDILERSYSVHRVRERVSSRKKRRYLNDYWVEKATGRCWKSRQIIIPRLPYLNIEVLKFPA